MPAMPPWNSSTHRLFAPLGRPCDTQGSRGGGAHSNVSDRVIGRELGDSVSAKHHDINTNVRFNQ